MNDPASTTSFTYRVATLVDAKEILDLLANAAPEIPMSLKTEAEQRMIQIAVGECLDGRSWVALDTAGKIKGVILARQDTKDLKALSLRYIAVNDAARGKGVFSALMEKLKSNRVPLTATVLSGNKSHMIDRLLKNTS